MSQNDLIDITCTFHAETARAILVSNDGTGNISVWLKKSQVEYESSKIIRNVPVWPIGHLEDGDEITVTMPSWLAKREWLI